MAEEVSMSGVIGVGGIYYIERSQMWAYRGGLGTHSEVNEEMVCIRAEEGKQDELPRPKEEGNSTWEVAWYFPTEV